MSGKKYSIGMQFNTKYDGKVELLEYFKDRRKWRIKFLNTNNERECSICSIIKGVVRDVANKEYKRPIIVGEIWDSKNFGKFEIINSYKKDKGYRVETMFDIKYLNTGHVIKCVQNSSIRQGNIVDNHAPTVQGVGITMGYSKSDNEILYKRWEKILSRCYNKNDSRYKDYGGSGVYVDADWLIFPSFLRDMKQKENYDKFMSDPRKWDIDKDIICNNKGIDVHYYSNDTVKIIPRLENIIESNKRMNVFTEENMRGISRTKTKNTYVYNVTYTNKDKCISKRRSFSVSKYGEEEAKRLAIEFRLKCEKEYSDFTNKMNK